jgi:hypothetical protein
MRSTSRTSEEEPIIESTWIEIAPAVLVDRDARRALRRVARRLSTIGSNGTSAQTIAVIRSEEAGLASEHAAAIAPALCLCIHVLCDLRAQGWLLRVDRRSIAILPPLQNGSAVLDDKARIRAAHLVERDAQLRRPAVQRFIQEMERRRSHPHGWHSIFSLMRDGRELATQLRHAAALPPGGERQRALRAAIDPYVQVVTPGAICEFTGLRLSDIWRYFRHTWTTTYQSTPGRKIFYIVRDRAAANHPVVGIGALGSAIVQLSVRDEWIGWTGPQLVCVLRAKPTESWARWLNTALDELIAAVFVDDLVRLCRLRPDDLVHPTRRIVTRLAEFARRERRIHRLYPARGQHKRVGSAEGAAHWAQQAGTHLFRSKRAAALAELLDARRRLQAAGFARPTAAHLRRVVTDHEAVRAIHTVLRYTKAVHVGVDMMDITVCGSVAPYNRVLGGKLVSLLMASPAVTAAYNRRYRAASSVIASSMAGQAVRRTPHLVLLGTTSLYGVGASQYNRLRLPAAMAGGRPGTEIAYVPLGRTAGYGSYHLSRETMQVIDVVLRRLQRGRPVNSIFGEGVNPRLRKARSALDAVGLPSDLLLQHGSPRLVYAIPLASNFREVLLGRTRRPEYVLPDGEQTTARIVDFWCERWLARRIESVEVLDDVARHSLAYPVQHGARVQLPEVAEQAEARFASPGEHVESSQIREPRTPRHQRPSGPRNALPGGRLGLLRGNRGTRLEL